LFKLTSLHFPSSLVSALVIATSASIELWHSYLGHVSFPRIQTLVSRSLLGSVSSNPFDCMPCQLGKQPALLFNNSKSIVSTTFDLIHSDVLGPSPVPTMEGSRYFVIFVDDFSCYTWIYLIKNHYEVLTIYHDFAKMIQTQYSKAIKVFHSGNAREYRKLIFLLFLNTMELFFIPRVLAPHNKMDELNVNSVTS
jgi:hypothetical protein